MPCITTDITENRAAVVSVILRRVQSRPDRRRFSDEDAECIVLSTGAAEDTPETPQELELLTEGDALLCFTSEAAMKCGSGDNGRPQRRRSARSDHRPACPPRPKSPCTLWSTKAAPTSVSCSKSPATAWMWLKENRHCSVPA